MQQSIKSQPIVFVIYGATGDLAWRKLSPALYNLYLDGWMPDTFRILGVGRQNITDQALRERFKEGVDKFSRSGAAEPERWN